MIWKLIKSIRILLPALCMFFFLAVSAVNAREDKPNVNLRVDTPVGGVEINRPPPPPVVVVPQPQPQRVVVEKPAPQPAPPPPAPAPMAPDGGCHCSLIPSGAMMASFLSLAPVAILPLFRRKK